MCCRPLGMNARYGVSGNTLDWKKGSNREVTVFYTYSALHCRLTATTLLSVVGLARLVLNIEF